MHWGNEFGMGFGFGGIFMVLFWGLVIVGVIYLVKNLTGGSSVNPPAVQESAGEVLGKRYARGEISKEEFEEAMTVLQKHIGA